MGHVVSNSTTRMQPLPESVISASENNACEEIGKHQRIKKMEEIDKDRIQRL